MLKVHSGVSQATPVNDDSNSGVEEPMAIRVDGLTRRYGKNRVVDNLSLAIPRGSVFGLIGPNGAGKSTTLKMLMGMLKITSGTATVLGADVGTDFQSVKHRVGYVPETHHLYRWMRIRRVIQFARSFYQTWNDEFCRQMLEMMELDPDKKIRQLSKGMLAKLALVIAVSHEPELLILDEPMSGLDPVVREEFIDGVMQLICDRDTTVVFSSHTIDDVQRLADSVGVLHEGQLLVNRPVEELLATTKRIRVVLKGSETMAWVPESTINQSSSGREWTLSVCDYSPVVLERLRSENQVDHIDVDDINLEELFKAYIIGKKRRERIERRQPDWRTR